MNQTAPFLEIPSTKNAVVKNEKTAFGSKKMLDSLHHLCGLCTKKGNAKKI